MEREMLVTEIDVSGVCSREREREGERERVTPMWLNALHELSISKHQRID